MQGSGASVLCWQELEKSLQEHGRCDGEFAATGSAIDRCACNYVFAVRREHASSALR